MSHRVFAWDANPAVDSRLYNLSDRRAAEQVASGHADFVILPDGRRAIQLRPTPLEHMEKVAGSGNLVPFGRVYNKLLYPPGINYPVPHAGDLGMHRHLRPDIQVSGRKLDFPALLRELRAC
jgi:hypothetical protein